MKTLRNRNLLTIYIIVMGLSFLISCKPKEKTYPKESNLDDYLSATVAFNGDSYTLNINRDTNHLYVIFDNAPFGQATLNIEATVNEKYYMIINLRVDSLGEILAGKQFPINNSQSIRTASCVYKNSNYSENEFYAKSGTLYIDQVFGYDEIKAHFIANLINGFGEKADVTNGKLEFD